jgi:hypothetical protein
MITLDLKVENNYADGYEETRNLSVQVTEPGPTDDVDDWGQDTLFEFTGTNTGRENVDALYTVTILSSDRADLVPVGKTFEWGG